MPNNDPIDPSVLFDLGDSGGSDIATNKDTMIAEAVEASPGRSLRSRLGNERDGDCRARLSSSRVS